MVINAEDLEIIRKFEQIMKKGLYASGQEVCAVYNRVLEKNARPSNCSSCIRRQITELVDAVNKFERMAAKAAEQSKPEEPTEVAPEENNVSEAPKARRVGRPKKDK